MKESLVKRDAMTSQGRPQTFNKFFLPLAMSLLVGIFYSCVPTVSPDQAANIVNKPKPVALNRGPNINTQLKLTLLKNGGSQSLPRLNVGNDPDGDFLYYVIVAPPRLGTLINCLGLNGSSNTDLNCQYEPFVDIQGLAVDKFSYAVLDGNGGRADVLVTLDILGNTSPVGVNRTISVLENGGAQSLGVLSPATDFDGDTLTYFVSTFPAKGTLVDCLGQTGSENTDLTCVYTPMSDVYGTDSFVYTVSDGRGGTATATITLNIQSSNGNPTVTPSTLTVAVIVNKGYQTVNLSSLVFADPDGTPPDLLSYTVTTPPSQGTLKNCLGLAGAVAPAPDLNCLYSPNTGVEGTSADVFYFTVADNNGGSRVVPVIVNIVNLTPSAETATKILTEDATGLFTLTVNDQGEGDILSVLGLTPLGNNGTFTGALTKGTLSDCMGLGGSLVTDVSCSYTPQSDISGSAVDAFTYRVTDLGGKTSDGTITIDLTGINDSPSWAAQTITAYENGGTQSITFAGATDPDSGETFSYSALSVPSPALGTLSACMDLSGSSTASDLICQFVPVDNATGTSSFTVQVTDSGSAVATSTVTLNLIPTRVGPAFPVDTFDAGTFTEAPSVVTQVALTTIPVPLGFTVGSTFNYTVLVEPDKGTLKNCLGKNATSASSTSVTAADLLCDYDLPVNDCGTPLTTFLIQVQDSVTLRGDTLPISINVTCNNVNPVPQGPSSVSIFEISGGQNLSASINTATDADTGPPADTMTYSLVSAPGNGTLSDCLGIAGASSTDLSCQYTIFSYLIGTNIVSSNFDSFTYRVTDDKGGSADETINIEVIGVNSAPTISGISAKSTTRNTGMYSVTTIVDEGGASDEDTQELEIQVTSSTASIFANSNIKIYYGADRTSAFSNFRGTGGASYVGLGDGTSNAGSKTVYLDIIPEDYNFVASIPIVSGTITVNVREVSTPSSTNSIAFQASVKNITAQHEGWSSVVAKGAKVDKEDEVVENDREVTLAWNSFTLSPASALTSPPSITGYNVFRSSTGSTSTDFEFGNPLNSTPISAGVRSFTDSSLTSVSDSVLTSTSAEAYWYRVRPVLSDGAQIDTSQNYNTLRVVLPPKNKSLVHRWMANLDVCTKIGQSGTIDKSNHFRCRYEGPGSTVVSGVDYYDLGKDLLVDRFEIGCPYTNDFCGGLDCIGTTTPNGSVTSAEDNIYYDRSTGKCYVNTDGGTTWKTIDELTDLNHVNRFQHVSSSLEGFVAPTAVLANAPKLPPLSHITQLEAYNYCNSTQFGINVTVSTGSGTLTGSPFYGRLPSRKEFIAAASWEGLTDSIINEREAGANLANTSACNSSNASGLIYLDNPPDMEYDAYPATAASGLKVLQTGSFPTRQCVSRYGLYDMIGNVQEWVTDHFFCENSNKCEAVTLTSPNTSTYFHLNNSDLTFYNNTLTYGLNDIIGPCVETSTPANTVCDTGDLTSWPLSAKTNNATKFYPAIGLPVVGTSTAPSTYGMFTIATSGSNIITPTQLHGDSFIINAQNISPGTGDIPYLGGITVGGSYSSGGAPAGVYFLELLDSFLFTSPAVGFRCVTPVSNP